MDIKHRVARKRSARFAFARSHVSIIVQLALYLPQVKLQKEKLAPQPAMSYEKREHKEKQTLGPQTTIIWT